MKAIFFGCLVIIFGSCTKPTFDIKPTPINISYDWGNYFYITPDSSNNVTAEITANGITSPFAVTGPNTVFTRNVYMQNNSDSSVISIYAFDTTTNTSLQINIVNIPREGTYKIDNTIGLHQTVTAVCVMGNNVYPDGSAQLSGSVTLDTLTSNHIHGLFSITGGSGTQTLDIRNGSFTGNF